MSWKLKFVWMLSLVSLTLSSTALADGDPTDLEKAEQWVYDRIVQVAPPGREIYYPEGQESKAEAEQRYRSIARDIVEVVFDPETKVPFRGKWARTQTASVVISLMFHESSFTKHVDYGLGKYARGDEGDSWCMMQLNIGDGTTLRWNYVQDRIPKYGDPEEEIFEGYKGEELIEDRQKCIQEGLKVIRISFTSCSDKPLLLRLAAYASGSCDKGHDESRIRMATAIKFFEYSKKSYAEDEVLLAVQDRLEEREIRLAAEEKAKEDEKIAKADED